MRPAVFLDRDGTLIEEVNFLLNEEQIKILPETIEALRLLREAGFLLIVVSNQSGVARGFLSEERVEELNRVVFSQMRMLGCVPDAFFSCPSHPLAVDQKYRRNLHCRKPETGMAEQAALKFEIDFTHSYAVGDKLADVGLGQNLGGKGALVLTGHGQQEYDSLSDESEYQPDFIADHVLSAARWIISDYSSVI